MLTLHYHDASEMAHSDIRCPSDLTILLMEDFGETLLRQYYEKKHGMKIVHVHTLMPDIFVSWDMTEVYKQQRQRWRKRLVSGMSEGQRRFNGNTTLAILTLSHAFMNGHGSQDDVILSRIRSFVGHYDDHLQLAFPICKRARGD